MWNFTYPRLAGAKLDASSVRPCPQLLDGGSRRNCTFASSDKVLQFKDHGCRPTDVSPLVLAWFLGSHLRSEVSGSLLIPVRTNVNESTTWDRHHFRTFWLNYLREKKTSTNKNGIAWGIFPPSTSPIPFGVWFSPICQGPVKLQVVTVLASSR